MWENQHTSPDLSLEVSLLTLGSLAPTPFIYILKLPVLQDIIVFEGKVLTKAVLAKMQSLVLVRPEYNITGILLSG